MVVNDNVIYYNFSEKHPSTSRSVESGDLFLGSASVPDPDDRGVIVTVKINGQYVYISPTYDSEYGFCWNHVVIDMTDADDLEFSSFNFYPNRSKTGDGFIVIRAVEINK